jgi:chemotaxis protein methyltransferase CheR
MQEMDTEDLKSIIALIRRKYGYDFSNYAISSFRRRVLRLLELKKLTPAALLEKLEEQSGFFIQFINEVTVNVTEMFRDHAFWNILRDEILPQIRKNRSQIKIWHAGCSSGEEVFSMAIVLKEMGIRDEVAILATDLDFDALEKGRSGSFPLKGMEVNEKNYKKFGGSKNSLAEYYTPQNGLAVFDTDLVRCVSFLKHDLVTGPVSHKFDLILCRNVMIYFNQALQNEVLRKFHRSLHVMGYLAIGSKESLIWCDISNKFVAVHNDQKIYQKIKE